MRILLISTSDSGGGAAHACSRLFEALLSSGADVRLLLGYSEHHLKHSDAIADTRLGKLQLQAYKALERLQILYQSGGNRTHLWRVSTAATGIDISLHPWIHWADVLHLHWVHHGFLGLTSLRLLAELSKPIVWTLHDLWAATGICHLPLHFTSKDAKLCTRLAHGCGACPLIGSDEPNDLSAKKYQTKAFLAKKPFHYTTVSEGAKRLFQHSPHFIHTPIEVIGPPIPSATTAAKDATAPPHWYDPKRKYLLLAAARIDDEVKGELLLRDVCAHIATLAPEKARHLTLILAGEYKSDYNARHYALDTQYTGKVTADTLRSLYGLASLTLSTSLFETFGQTLTEALSNGCPVVSFSSGGPEDIIIHGINGYLVPCYDTKAYATAVLTALNRIEAGELTPEACRHSVKRFTPTIIAQKHLELYDRLLSPTSR